MLGIKQMICLSKQSRNKTRCFHVYKDPDVVMLMIETTMIKGLTLSVLSCPGFLLEWIHTFVPVDLSGLAICSEHVVCSSQEKKVFFWATQRSDRDL